MYKLLDKYSNPKDIKKMSFDELDELSKEIRDFLIENVSRTGGHLASNLGVVELTLSLYKVFDLDIDKLVWDVGHQAYIHKILTGRKDKFNGLRQYNGLSGFPKRCESKYDAFETGHSSTSISAALGIARARDIKKEQFSVIPIIGDGALTGGMAFEALNDVGFRKTKMIIILNDNQMSIANNVGGLSTYLSKLRLDPSYNKLKNDFNSTMTKTALGKGLVNSINKLKDSIKQFIVPGMLFEEMGIKYLGPIDGHDIRELSKVLSMAKNIEGPVLIHAITQKGRGYDFAEKNPNKFHGIGPFNCCNGEICVTSEETYSKAFGEELIKIAEKNEKVVAVTAAMPDGTGLRKFSQAYPGRFFDVGIAEQHAVTFSAGLANEGLKPIFAVYSTFLQRAYDQVLHDVCIQNLPVVFAIDRAGIVGEDGETHQGVFDLSYLNHIPNITLMAPKCIDELKIMLNWAVDQDFPIAIRYPRGGDYKNINIKALPKIDYGKWEIIDESGKIAVIATGKMVQHALIAKEQLKSLGLDITVVNACFIKPLDYETLDYLAKNNYDIITLEDNVVTGGLGSAVNNYFSNKNIDVRINMLGFKDEFITHGDLGTLYKLYKLDADSIVEFIKTMY